VKIWVKVWIITIFLMVIFFILALVIATTFQMMDQLSGFLTYFAALTVIFRDYWIPVECGTAKRT